MYGCCYGLTKCTYLSTSKNLDGTEISFYHSLNLIYLFQGLSKRDRTTFSNLKEFVSSNENWKRLRQHLTNTKLPCIPYLGKQSHD
jgi:hypothetical protein